MRGNTSDTALNVLILIGIIGLLWFHFNFNSFDKSSLDILTPKDNMIDGDQGNITVEHIVERITTTTIARKYSDNDVYIIVTTPFNDTYILKDMDMFRSIEIGKSYSISYSNTTEPVNYILPAD